MTPDARKRLKAELALRGISARGLSIKLGCAPTYVSRIITGGISEPSSKRINAICNETGINWDEVLMPLRKQTSREALLSELSSAPDEVIEQVIEFLSALPEQMR